ncbi:ABC transporter substrate-binding protein [Paeniglutamicibacter psychrophenolicus]|uniref:Polar amino acid transport system substrate-binding protein n=1 Tax=Paeniglutamicibacter psychrophenolicus TaxID=257454 RepID=A0ABS4W9P8_9MICC|nr:ABC transporter substrate-binding protein [Paeniglutamicibacter psychrophenolicus]MBP2372920.1 polar amino acid transport system substrate-binding protein [Paeniglutamicibacter psychrophenolicus]
MSIFTKQSPRRTALAVSAAVAALALTLSGCSTTEAASTTPSAAVADGPTMAAIPAAAALVPESIRSSGVLRIAIPTNEPPTQYYKEGTEIMTGINPDLSRLLAGALDLKPEIMVSSFDSIIPGLSADRFDMTMSSMAVNEQRLAVLDFVDYVKMGTGLAVPSGNPGKVSLDDLCGKKVAALSGSYQVTAYVPEFDAACAKAGRPALVVKQFQDTRQAISSITSGRDDAVFADLPILAHATKQTSGIEIAGTKNVLPVGIGMPKGGPLTPAVAAAMKEIVKSPEYKAVLENYGIEKSAVEEARVNIPRSAG